MNLTLQFINNKSINHPKQEIKKQKIMNLEEPKSNRYVEVYATDNKEVTMIIRKFIGEEGVHETYMDIYNKLMSMEKDVKWKIELFRVRSLKSIYYNEIKEEEV